MPTPRRATRWLFSLSLRTRLMIIGAAGLAVALAVGGLGLYGALTLAVNRTLDNEALAAAQEVRAMVEQQRVPSPIPVSGAQLIQLVDAQGRVAGGSATADRLVPLLRPDELVAALGGAAVTVPGSRVAIAGPLRVRAVAAAGSTGPVSVIVAVQVRDVMATRAALRNALLVTFPLMVALLAAIAWRVIGWTLQPVEALRLGAERIGGATGRVGPSPGDADERLPVPLAADEIRALAQTLNSMLDRLAGAQARQRAFVADAAHELRSPLTSLRTQLEVARHLGEGGRLPDDLLVDLDRLSTLVSDLLLLARLDAGQPRASEQTRFDARDLLAEVAAGYAGARVPVTVRADDADTPVELAADRAELRRVVTNLVDNAVRHAVAGVVLSADSTGTSVAIRVADDGPGIPVADRERVFDRFARLDDARTRDDGGSGLGLAIVRDLVERAGGTVGFGTDPATSAATVRLPRGF